MSKLQYLNKRDERGVLLSYSALELSYRVTNNAIKIIKSTEAYDSLITKLPKKYIDLYYSKMIHESFLPIAHQLVIYKYDKQHHSKAHVHSIDATGFPCQALLRQIWPDKDIEFSISNSSKIKKRMRVQLYTILKSIYKLKNISNQFNPKYNNSSTVTSNGTNIAFNYFDGFDINKRSDLFWFNGSAVDPKSVVVYYSSPVMMTHHDSTQKAVEVFHELGIRQVKLWEWYPLKKYKALSDQVMKPRSIHTTDGIELWLMRSAVNLFKRINFWLTFFQEFGIKLHLDPFELGLETIIKQIAITLLGGLSIGKIRSHPMSIDFWYFYPNDVFFSWGLDNAKKINLTNEHIENILISGFQYSTTNKKPDNEIIAMEAKLKSNGTKFNILLLDSNHSYNKDLTQLIETSTMVSFYRIFLDWVLEDEEIGVIIKPKKSHLLKSLPGVISYLEKVEKKTGRCLLVNNSYQKMPSSYLKGIDIVVGTGVFFSSAVVECVLHGAKGIFYDFTNLRYHEPDLYAWGENKVIFSEFDSMVSALKAYKNNPLGNTDIGDWSPHLDVQDPFRDGKGGERIGTYVRWLKEAFDKGLERQDAIELANEFYAGEWGDDKIYSRKCVKEN